VGGRYPRMEYRLVLPPQGITELSRPETAKQLQHLLSAHNWIRSSIPDYARNVAFPQELLRRCQEQVNSAKASNLSRISLVHGDTWMTDHDTVFSRVKELVSHAVTWAYPKQDYEMCLFTDANDFHWGIILTQVPKTQLKISVHDQEHEPLAFLSGSFNANQCHWSDTRRNHSQSWTR
jgi:hypothetical protein